MTKHQDLPLFHQGNPRPALFRFLACLALVAGALGLSLPVNAQTSDVTLDYGVGGSVDLTAGHFRTYETTFSSSGGTLDDVSLAQRKFDADGVQLRLVRNGDWNGLPLYIGLGKVTEPGTGITHSGWILGFGLPDPDRTRITAAVLTNGLSDVALAFELYVKPAPDLPIAPPLNTFMADSVAPIGHLNSAQSDSSGEPGPIGQAGIIPATEITYEFLGPGRFGLAISSPYSDGERVIWSNGSDRISKIDYDTFAILAELPIPGKTLMDEATAESRVTTLDTESGDALATAALPIAASELAGLAGVYYVLDKDNTLFVGGATSILAYGDAVPDVRGSDIELKAEWIKPAGIGGNFVGANMTFDGKLCLVTDEGWVVIAERDFSDWDAIQLTGNSIAPQWNADKIAEGFRPGSASWVRNSAAIGQDGGIYVPSLEHMHKVIWDGTALSIDPADGAWVAPFLNGRGIGTGATPSLMGFGDEDKFVVITDGEDLMNVVLYWRDDIPTDWVQLPGTPDRRIAGQLPADFNDPALTAVQSEQSVIIGGYGAAVVNNEPASVPAGFPVAAKLLLAGYAGNDSAFTPLGIMKMEWDPAAQEFKDAWVQPNVSSANSVPIVSTRSNLMYTVGGRNDEWSLEAVDWQTGASAFYWITGSQRYNTRYSGLFLDEEGRITHTTTYGIMRYER